MEDLNKTDEFNPISEKSKELITSMGSCARSLLKYNALVVLCIGQLALYIALAANVCSRRNGIDS